LFVDKKAAEKRPCQKAEPYISSNEKMV